MPVTYYFNSQTEKDAAMTAIDTYEDKWAELMELYKYHGTFENIDTGQIKIVTDALIESLREYFKAIKMPDEVIDLVYPTNFLLDKNEFKAKANEILTGMEEKLQVLKQTSTGSDVAELENNINKLRDGIEQMRKLGSVAEAPNNIAKAKEGGFVANSAIPFACCIVGAFVGALSMAIYLGGRCAFDWCVAGAYGKYSPFVPRMAGLTLGISGFVYGAITGLKEGAEIGGGYGWKSGKFAGKVVVTYPNVYNMTRSFFDTIDKNMQSLDLTKEELKKAGTPPEKPPKPPKL